MGEADDLIEMSQQAKRYYKKMEERKMTMLTAEEATSNIILRPEDKRRSTDLIREIRKYAGSIMTLLQEDFEPGEEVKQIGNMILDIELDAKNLSASIKELSEIETDEEKEVEQIRNHRLGDVK